MSRMMAAAVVDATECDGTFSEVDELRALLTARERDLQLAAELGKALLDSNRDLAERYDAAVADCAKRVGDLEQEVHVHKSRADTAHKSAAIVRADGEREIASLTAKLADALQRASDVERRMACDSDSQAATVARLQDELSAARMCERQLQGRVLQQFDLIAALKDELAAVHASRDDRDGALVDANARALLDRVGVLEESLHLAADAREQATHALVQVAAARDEAYAARALAHEQLCEAREEMAELRMEIAGLTTALEDARSGVNGRIDEGMSLFSEVEDRRAELERKLSAMGVQYAAAKRACDVQRRLVQSLRTQIAGLLRMGGSRADAEHCRRLEQALAQSAGEAARLADRVAQLEGGHGMGSSHAAADARRMRDFRAAFGAPAGGALGGDREAYIECLEGAVRASEVALEQCRGELRTARMTRASESAKVREAEHELHKCQVQRDQLHADIASLQLRLEEARAASLSAPSTDAAVEPMPARIAVSTAAVSSPSSARAPAVAPLNASGVANVAAVGASVPQRSEQEAHAQDHARPVLTTTSSSSASARANANAHAHGCSVPSKESALPPQDGTGGGAKENGGGAKENGGASVIRIRQSNVRRNDECAQQ